MRGEQMLLVHDTPLIITYRSVLFDAHFAVSACVSSG
jgi:hypothetical protein